eukprot:287585-Rhodomonas_salina.1
MPFGERIRRMHPMPFGERPQLVTASLRVCKAARQVTGGSTPRNKKQETAFLAQCVPKMRFLVLDFGVYVKVRGA